MLCCTGLHWLVVGTCRSRSVQSWCAPGVSAPSDQRPAGMAARGDSALLQSALQRAAPCIGLPAGLTGSAQGACLVQGYGLGLLNEQHVGACTWRHAQVAVGAVALVAMTTLPPRRV